MSIFLMFVLAMVPRLVAFWPNYLNDDTAMMHVIAAEEAGKDLQVKDGATEILLALAYTESRFDPTATSRIVNGKRVVGSWPSKSPAGHGPWFCGVHQTMAYHDWKKCLEMRDISRGYKAGVAELNEWLKKTNGNILHALYGHQCGNIGPSTGCYGKGYGPAVLRLAQKLKIRPTS